MEVTELISTLQSHLDTKLSAEVLVSGSDQRPVPGVIVEDWSVTNKDGSMNNYIQSTYDDQGNETARFYRIPYDCRVSFMVRGGDEITASQLNDRLRKELFKIQTHPNRLSSSLSRAMLNSGGGVSHQFVNPSEHEYNQTATFSTSLIYKETEYDNIESFTTEINIVD